MGILKGLQVTVTHPSETPVKLKTNKSIHISIQEPRCKWKGNNVFETQVPFTTTGICILTGILSNKTHYIIYILQRSKGRMAQF